MAVKKRVSAIAVPILLVLAPVFAGYCLDYLSPFYCEPVTEQECCGADCASGKYSASDDKPPECVYGCCFAAGLSTICVPYGTAKGLCDENRGEWAQTCGQISGDKCEEGCCCWDENGLHSDATGERKYRGRCEAIPKSLYPEFYPGVLTEKDCAQECLTEYWPKRGREGLSECSDGIDNDGDEMIDYPADIGCSELADQSEQDPAIQCDDGLNNDPEHDEDIDMSDTCCQKYPDKAEDFCDIALCPTDGQIGSEVDECRCRDAYRCRGRQYCCHNGCMDEPCGSESCMPGERMSCGSLVDGCETFRYCNSEGQWSGQCTPDPMCAAPVEICHDGIDNNQNGKVDCQDVSCHDVECSSNEASCASLGYYDSVHDLWKCCYGTTSDCDQDGTADSCSGCDCRQSMPDPYLTAVEKPQGESGVVVEWGLNCDVPAYVYRCEANETTCESIEDYTRVSPAMDNRSYSDEGIYPQKVYCYYVQADYGSETRASDAKCVATGDPECMEYTDSEFCLDESMGTSSVRVIRAQCSANNSLTVIENCRGDNETGYRGNFICVGPYAGQGTRCVYQSPCDMCGTPLSMFTDYYTAQTEYQDPQSGALMTMGCDEVPACYYDYSETTVDKFHECAKVTSCYQYRSEFACEDQPGDFTNNKCLGRECSWQQVTDLPDTGICFETSSDFVSCQYCNAAQNNGILDHCTAERCMQFGDCYTRRLDGQCLPKERITCNDYMTEEVCTGWSAVKVSAEYDSGARVSGDNSIEPSQDALGIGLCRWDAAMDPECFKDADGDSRPDPSPQDKTPPYTRLLTPPKVLALNFTMEVTDYSPEGKPGSGVWRTFVCASEEECYPNTVYYPKNGIVSAEFGGTGVKQIYYYSEDLAHNLEVVSSAEIEVDKTKPRIDITPYVFHDMQDYVNSSVTFVVQLSENATCTDSFEGAGQLAPSFGSRFVVRYHGLGDGTYTYKVNCTDTLGNTGVAYEDVRIQADPEIFDPKPRGKIDYTPVTLSISTLKNANCRWGPQEADFDRLPNSFGPAQAMDGHYFHHSTVNVKDSGTYSFDVKCRIGSRISDDEIQFVYDVLAPVTKAYDIYSLPFDFQKWYNGIDEKVFLDCHDSPQNGFGCDRTYYCMDESRCTPNRRNDPSEPLAYNISASENTWLCYYSVERETESMGGLTEKTVCRGIKVDHDPPIITLRGIGTHDTPDNPYHTGGEYLTVSGTVHDPDAQGTPDNTVRIIVASGNSSEKSYDNIRANEDFQQAVQLSRGHNIIMVIATDRSGATAEKTVYAMLSNATGAQVFLIKPNRFGVSRSRVFELQVMTKVESHCRYSLNDAGYEFSGMMERYREPAGQGYNYYHTKERFELENMTEVEHPVYIKCKDVNGAVFRAVFNLSWDDSAPVIQEIGINPGDGKDPPSVVEPPFETSIYVVTDDKTRCKYSVEMESYDCCMTGFDSYENQSLKARNSQFFGGLLDKKTYSYFIQCQNGAGLISSRKLFSFDVDTDKETGFSFLSPPKYSMNSTVAFLVRTSRMSSDCKYASTPNPGTAMTAVDNHTHTATVVVAPGTHTYYFSCKTYDRVVSDSYTFTVDQSPPTVPVIDDGSRSWYTVKLSAKWESSDPESAIAGYNYTIGTTPGSSNIHPWTYTNQTSATVTGLDLSDGTVYYWAVRARNKLGLYSYAGLSDGILIDTDANWTNNTGSEKTVDSCYNRVVDRNETDVDCGGVCGACASGYSCTAQSDCLSRICLDGVCKAPSCNDSVMNQDETDTDCGGICPGCGLGSYCIYNSDCASGYCSGNSTCEEGSCTDGVKNGDETGTDCGGSCPPCEDAINRTGTCRDQYGDDDTDCDGMPDWWEREYSEVLNHMAGDADEDPDSDGYTNYEEYIRGTDPAVSEAGSTGRKWLLWLLLFVIAAGGLYVGYAEYQKRQPHEDGQRPPPPQMAQARISVSPGPRPRSRPQDKYLKTLGDFLRRRRRKDKQERRKDLISSFEDREEDKGSGKPAGKEDKPSDGGSPKAPRQAKPSAKRAGKDGGRAPKPQKDVFEDLEKIAGAKK